MVTSALVPGAFDVAINGRPFLLDRSSQQFRIWTQQIARNQADTAEKAGEQSLSRESLWRRTLTSWHRGAGQAVYDDTTGDPYRFNKSLGMDIWTPGRLKPLGGLATMPMPFSNPGRIVGGTGTTNLMVNYNGIPYITGSTNNTVLAPITDTAITAASVTNGWMSLCTNGAVIYGCDKGGGGTGGDIVSTTGGGGAATSYKTGAYYLVRWAKGRLWAANATQLVNVTSSSTETVAYADPTTNWTWTDVVAGDGCVLASGYDQTQSFIVAIGLLPDGSGISGGTVIADLPVGERVTAMHSGLGYVLLGTNKGVRCCVQDGNRLVIGPLLDLFSPDANAGLQAPPTTAVRCFAAGPKGFVYFGWSFYDWSGQTTSNRTSGTFYAGLGRLNLAEMVGTLQPAYATDVMVPVINTTVVTSGEVTGCAVNEWGIPSFVIDDYYLYMGTIPGSLTPGTYYTSGSGPGAYLRTGKIILGVDDLKVLSALHVRTDNANANADDLVVSMAVESAPSTFTTVDDVPGTATSTRFDLVAFGKTEAVELKLAWRDYLAIAKTVFDLRLEAWPSPRRVERVQLPLLLSKEMVRRDGATHVYASVEAELDALRTLASPSGRAIVDVQIGGTTYQMVVDDIDWRPMAATSAAVPVTEWGGTLVVALSRGLD